jgi:GNAT superfamily N-acetyltransferase
MLSSTTIVPASESSLAVCLRFDHVAREDSGERRTELSEAAEQDRIRVALVDDRPEGYSVVAPWFFGAPFLALVYVNSALRGHGIGSRLLEDFEQTHGARVFTSTNLSNAPMQRLLRHRLWTPCGLLDGLDQGDPEIFFSRAV